MEDADPEHCASDDFGFAYYWRGLARYNAGLGTGTEERDPTATNAAVVDDLTIALERNVFADNTLSRSARVVSCCLLELPVEYEAMVDEDLSKLSRPGNSGRMFHTLESVLRRRMENGEDNILVQLDDVVQRLPKDEKRMDRARGKLVAIVDSLIRLLPTPDPLPDQTGDAGFNVQQRSTDRMKSLISLVCRETYKIENRDLVSVWSNNKKLEYCDMFRNRIQPNDDTLAYFECWFRLGTEILVFPNTCNESNEEEEGEEEVATREEKIEKISVDFENINLKSFIRKIESKRSFFKEEKMEWYVSSQNSNHRNMMDSIEKQESMVLEELCQPINEFFGGELTEELEGISLEEIIERLEDIDVFSIGDLKSFGANRHRLILFKVACDVAGVPCRLYSESCDLRTSVLLGNVFFHVDVSSNALTRIEMDPAKSLAMRTLEHDYGRRYRDEFNEVGSGDSSVVYRFEYQPKIGQTCGQVAVKEINITTLRKKARRHGADHSSAASGASISGNERGEERVVMLRREILQMQLFSHPNIVKFLGFFDHATKRGTVRCLVMDGASKSGMDLVDLLEERDQNRDFVLSPQRQLQELLFCFLSMANGLRYLHRNGMIHSDLKPTNVLIFWDEEERHAKSVVLCDFSRTKRIPDIVSDFSGLAKTGPYADPDIASEHHSGEMSDIYSFGVMLRNVDLLKYYDDRPGLATLSLGCIEMSSSNRPTTDEVIKTLLKELNRVNRDLSTEEKTYYSQDLDDLDDGD